MNKLLLLITLIFSTTFSNAFALTEQEYKKCPQDVAMATYQILDAIEVFVSELNYSEDVGRMIEMSFVGFIAEAKTCEEIKLLVPFYQKTIQELEDKANASTQNNSAN